MYASELVYFYLFSISCYMSIKKKLNSTLHIIMLLLTFTLEK